MPRPKPLNLPEIPGARMVSIRGGVGTGFNTKTLNSIHATLRRQALREPPTILLHGGEKPPRTTTWVNPKLIVETEFFEWTPGGTMRHPVFLGLREDKSPADVVRDPPLRKGS
jgi:bifunctional non-homologous end joining protein LigD